MIGDVDTIVSSIMDSDKKAVEKVSSRIFSESDSIEDTLPEPEWIAEMTMMAEKYMNKYESLLRASLATANKTIEE